MNYVAQLQQDISQEQLAAQEEYKAVDEMGLNKVGSGSSSRSDPYSEDS